MLPLVQKELAQKSGELSPIHLDRKYGAEHNADDELKEVATRTRIDVGRGPTGKERRDDGKYDYSEHRFMKRTLLISEPDNSSYRRRKNAGIRQRTATEAASCE